MKCYPLSLQQLIIYISLLSKQQNGSFVPAEG
jgi:hypothetical protein